MPREQLGTVLQFVRKAMSGRTPANQNDTDLLERFAIQREEAAFSLLLERHGPMVLGVCRRVLHNAEDVADAFQATFLVLLRKAGTIRKRASVASWLYGVALRVAMQARTRAARQRTYERQAERGTPADPQDEAAAGELRAILDEELQQLPAKYRAPVVLHYLQGKTKDETARQLGWSEGTVSGRLARARERLRMRLTRRGVVLPAAALAAGLSQEAATASLSPALLNATLNLASLYLAGEVAAGASGTRALALTQRMLHTMFLSKLRLTTALLLAAAVVGLGTGGLLYWARAEQPAEEQAPPAPEVQAAGNLAVQSVPAAAKRQGAIFRTPGSYTLAVAVTADGKLLARGGADNTVDLWDVASGKKLHTLTGHTVPILRLAFSPDGKTLASITGSWLPDEVRGEVKLWEVATGKERVSLKIGKGRAGPLSSWNSLPWSLAFSPDGKTIATSAGGGIMDITPSSVILWEVATGKERATFSGHSNSITWVGFAPDGKTLASASGAGGVDEQGKPLPGEIKLWDVVTAKERVSIPIRLVTPLQFFDLTFTPDYKSLISATASFGETQNDGGHAVTQWELPSGMARATFWAPLDSSGPPGAGTNAGVYFTALSADGKTVAWGGAEERDKKITGTAEVWEVQSLATAPPKIPKQPENPAAAKRRSEQVDSRFGLQPPTPATFLYPGEAKAVAIGLKRGMRFKEDEDLTLTFTDTDVPKGVTFDPAHPVIRHPDTEAKFTIKAADGAALGDFAIKVTGRAADGGAVSNLFNLSVVPKGASARSEKPGKPAARRQYLRRSRDPFTGTFDFSMAADESAKDGKVVSSAGGNLVMRSKEDGKEHTYTLAANPQISYNNAACKLEDLQAGMVVRVTAKKDKPQAATRIEAVNHYGAFVAEYEERERLRKRDK